MKKIKKIAIALLSVTIILVFSLLLIAELAEDKVANIALKHINKQINASVSIKDINLSFIRKFPNAELELSELCLENENDTLANIQRVFISVKIYPLINNEFKITNITVEEGNLNYKVDSLGISNYSVLLSPSDTIAETLPIDTTKATISIDLNEMLLNNIVLQYTDDKEHISASVYIKNGLLGLYANANNINANFKGSFKGNNFNVPNTNIYLMQNAQIYIDASIINDSLSIRELNLETDGTQISIYGNVKKDTALIVDLNIPTLKIDINEVKKYIPDSTFKQYNIKQLAGTLEAQATAKGMYKDSTLIPLINVTINLNNANLTVGEYPEVTNINLLASLTNGEKMNNETSLVEIENLSFNFANSYAKIKAKARNFNLLKYETESSIHLELKDIANLLPDSLNITTINGGIDLNLKTSGVLLKEYNNLRAADYLLSKTKLNLTLSNVNAAMKEVVTVENLTANLEYLPTQITVNNLSCKLPDYSINLSEAKLKAKLNGKLNAKDSQELIINELMLNTNNSIIEGDIKLVNHKKTKYNIDIKTSIDINQWKQFIPENMINNISGIAKVELKSQGIINPDDIINDAMHKLFTESNFRASLTNVNVGTTQNINIENLNTNLAINNDTISIKKFEGAFNEITFKVDPLAITSFYKGFWLNNPDTIKLDANITLGNVDYAAFEPFMESKTASVTTESTQQTKNSEPAKYKYLAKGKIKIASLKYEKAMLEDISTLYRISDNIYIADKLTFSGFDGKAVSSFSYETTSAKKGIVKFKTKLNNIDVQRFLYDFDNFSKFTDDEYIRYDQLSGVLSSEFNGFATIINDTIDMNSMMMSGDIKIEDGRLKNYDMAVEMGKELKIPELANLQFKTIDTKMFMHKGAMYIPQTNVNTNTFNVTLMGQQKFNMDCEYYLRLYFKEILRKGKTQTIEKKQSKEEKVKEDGGIKGMMSIFPFCEIKDGEMKVGVRGNNNPDRQRMSTLIFLQENGLKLSFHPKGFKFETGVN